jgi:hypothetical protein
MVTFMTQILHPLHSLALLLSLSLIHRRLRSHGTLAIGLGLKSTNHSLLRTHVTFFQTLSFSQTLLLMSLYRLLLSSSPTLKQIPPKSSLKRVIPHPIGEINSARLYKMHGTQCQTSTFRAYMIAGGDAVRL